jgi:hypothetical protein
VKKIIREPLLHFLLIGVLLFVVFAYFRDSDGATADRIVLTQNNLQVLLANFARTWQRQPTRQELDNLVENWIREEIAYREALALGLEKEDAVIKRRLKMKLDLMLEDMAGLDQPDEQELVAYLEQHRDRFRREAELGFSQVFFKEETPESEIDQALAQLARAGAAADLHQFGDPIMLPARLPLTPLDMIDNQFGSDFAANLADIEVGTWQGPLRSGYGLHLVLVLEKRPAIDPQLEEVRDVVVRELMAERIEAIKEDAYAGLRENYEIVWEPGAQPGSGSHNRPR